MLYYTSIDTKTLELLKKLQKLDIFSGLRLVGGTALALQYGHRKSIDIDLFGKINADDIEILDNLNKIGNVNTISLTNYIKIFTIDDIKLDIVNYPYKWLEPAIKEDQIRLASDKDIAAMKLSAITNRGSKKDFVDIFFLMKHYTLKEMLQFYEQKYNDGSVFLVFKSLVYFDDAENDELPEMLIKEDWEDIKKHIINETLKI